MTRRNKRELPNARQAAFLAAYAECGVVGEAARIAGVSRQQHYRWMEDADYAAAFAEANEQACDALETECRRRAVEGWEEPVIFQGQLMMTPVLGTDGQPLPDPRDPEKLQMRPLTVRKKSETLLIFITKAARPDKYRDNAKVEITGAVELVERLTAARQRLKQQ